MGLLFTVLLSIVTTYAGTINDKANFLPTFEQKLSSKKFTDLHACNFKANYNEGVEEYGVQCQDDGMGMSCAEWAVTNDMIYGKTIQSCTESEQIILTDKGTVETYTAAEFAENHGNYAKKFLENMDTYIGYKTTLVIDSFADAEMTIASQTPNERKIKVINVKGHLDFIDIPYSSNFIMSVSADVAGPIQVLRFRLGDTNFVRVLDF